MTLNNNVSTLISFVIQLLENQSHRTEQDIDNAITSIRSAFTHLSDAEFKHARKMVMERLAVAINLGITIVEDKDYTPWYSQNRHSLDSHYWNRYRQLLAKQGLSTKVIQTLDQNTNHMMDLFGNPLNHTLSWKRRGLVMGDVQSGKTSNYIGLACKAADSGYKLIIILSGTIESLRKQTQERLDEGFVGIDSSKFLSDEKKAVSIGVGNIDPSIVPAVLTSASRDFSIDLAKRLHLGLNNLSTPLLVVMKKNKSILENFNNWISQNHMTPINKPVLIIDDEADNASINVRNSNDNPTEINKQIRSIINKFTQSTYVGFTATPFANIFISPDNYTDAYGDDLFPKDFIYSLNPPSNYTSATTLIESEPSLIRYSDEAEDVIPLKHTKNHELTELPTTLIDAIHVFFITTTIRDLTNGFDGHRSMLINVSRFIAMQNNVSSLVNDYVYSLQQDIKSYSKTPTALHHSRISKLKYIFDTEFKSEAKNITWNQVQEQLFESTDPIETVTVHSQSTKALDYSAYKNNKLGYRVIVVGGNAISRGITLEGLSTSYFHRQSLQYDTLLQMGRWFGYREGYQNLCRIWMPAQTESHFAHVASVVSELRQELRIMYDAGARPYDFGLRVRTHPDLLLITARNKMRNSQTIDIPVDFSGRTIETPYLSKNAKELQSNLLVTQTFINSLLTLHASQLQNNSKSGIVWTKIYPNVVSSYIKQLQIHKRNEAFIDNILANFLVNTSVPELAMWDIAIASGEGETIPIADGLPAIYKSKRQILIEDKNGSEFNWLQVSSRRKVGSGNSITLGLSDQEITHAAEMRDFDQPTNIPIREYYAMVRSRPIMVIYFIEPVEDNTNKHIINNLKSIPLVALSINFPRYTTNTHSFVTYAINQVMIQQLGLGLDYTDDDDGGIN
jgi:hypothetical protein